MSCRRDFMSARGSLYAKGIVCSLCTTFTCGDCARRARTDAVSRASEALLLDLQAVGGESAPGVRADVRLLQGEGYTCSGQELSIVFEASS